MALTDSRRLPLLCMVVRPKSGHLSLGQASSYMLREGVPVLQVAKVLGVSYATCTPRCRSARSGPGADRRAGEDQVSHRVGGPV